MKVAFSISGWRRRRLGIALHFGDAVDKGTLNPDADRRLDGKELFREIWDAEEVFDRSGLPQEVDPGAPKGENSRRNLTIAGDNRVQDYREKMDSEEEDGREVVNIQHDFAVKDPVDPDSGDLDLDMSNVVLVGTRDLLENVPIQEIDSIAPAITDVKTGQAWGKEFFQLMFYTLTHLYETGELIEYVGNVFLSKSMNPKEPVVRRFYPIPDKKQKLDETLLVDTYLNVKDVARDIRSGRFRREPTSCHEWGKTCQYHALCFPQYYEDPDATVAEDLFNIIDEKGLNPDEYYEKLAIRVRETGSKENDGNDENGESSGS